jgi:hypothetical protein
MPSHPCRRLAAPGAALLLAAAACAPDRALAPAAPSDAPASTALTPGDLRRAVAATSELPALPATLNTAYVAPTGRRLPVAPGGDLQAAIDSARAGDVILLRPGATYVGNFVLRAKDPAATAAIVIRTDVTLPSGTRMTPTRARSLQLARVVTTRDMPVFRTVSGAHHWRLMGLEVTADSARTAMVSPLVQLGYGADPQTSLATIARDLVLDRLYVHGHPSLRIKRCVALNSASTGVVESWVSDCHSDIQDSQAVGGTNGPGPYRIHNNYLEGAGENVMFGGADPTIPDLVPSDIEVTGNHVAKPLAWKDRWLVKNLLELKNARRVLVEGNVFENNWVDGQSGTAIVLKSVNQSGDCPWCVTRDVTVRYNRVRNVAAGFSIAARPETHPALPARLFLVAHNLVDGVGASNGTANGRQFALSGDLADVTITHNTLIPNRSGAQLVSLGGSIRGTDLTYTNQVQIRTAYGVGGTSVAEGTAALDKYWASYTFAGNVMVAGSASKYPAGNMFPATIAALGFVDYAGGNYRLASTSLYAGRATDGTNPGANIDLVTSKTAGVVVAP